MLAWARGHIDGSLHVVGDGLQGAGMTTPRKRDQIYLDGEPTTYQAIQLRFDCSPVKVLTRLRKYGRMLTSSMFEKKKQPVAISRPHVEDRSPGWLERKEFPNAGKNGFSKCPVDSFGGYDSRGHGVYSGSKS